MLNSESIDLGESLSPKSQELSPKFEHLDRRNEMRSSLTIPQKRIWGMIKSEKRIYIYSRCREMLEIWKKHRYDITEKQRNISKVHKTDGDVSV